MARRGVDHEAEAGNVETLTSGLVWKVARRFRLRRSISLRTRLLLLMMSSAVPLVCLGFFREYLDYRTQRGEIYDGLLAIAGYGHGGGT